jgi:hypothetical protein
VREILRATEYGFESGDGFSVAGYLLEFSGSI